MNKKDFKKAKKELLSNFDFEKVNDVMKKLEWKWEKYNRVPNKRELRKAASDLLDDAYIQSDNKDISCVQSGGFVAQILSWNTIDLYFVITGSDFGYL